jgi:hypothetical protein
MPLQRILFVVALLFAALTSRRGEASSIPWSYQWSASPIVLNADPLGPHHAPIGGITLTPGAITITGGSTDIAHGNANIIAVNLTAFTFAPTPNGAPYHFTDSPYSLNVTLTDVNSRNVGSLRFNGVFEGSFTDHKMDLATHFLSATRQYLPLGHDLYTVTLTSYTPPDPPSDGGAGNISAFVNVQPLTTAEPSSLILATAGGIVALALWRRRPQDVPAAI